MNRIFAVLLAMSTASFTFAQHQALPHVLAPEEIGRIPAYRASHAADDRATTTPPDFPVRTMAEWEEIQTLCICWAQYEGILKQIVRYAKDECQVLIVCDDSLVVKNTLLDNTYGGPLPNLNNIVYLIAPFNSVWIRDYGAECIYRNEVDSLYLMDWIYNRPRPEDDAVPDAIGAFKNIPVYGTTATPYDLVGTGGNFQADGAGTVICTNLILDDNGSAGQYNLTVRNEAQVDAIMQQFMGIPPARYIKMTDLPNDVIHHVDMHLKMIDEERLLVGEFPQGVSDGPQMEANVQAIMDNEVNTFGQPYRMVRIPMPSSTGGNYPPDASYRTYANNVFVNKTILVPTYRTEYDTTALRILQEAQPGYRIIGIDCDNNDANIISASGALHCITKAIGVEEPMLIRHQSLQDTYDTQNPYAVTAYIRHKSGIASARLFWSIDTTQAWNEVDMADLGSGNWSAAIPAQPFITTVYYFVQGTANSGKVQVRPIVAPLGWFHFRVLDINSSIADPQGPAIMEVFPNPCSSHLVITLDRVHDERVRISVSDMLGRETMLLHNGPIAHDGRIFLDVTPLPVGTYALTVESPLGRTSQRIVKDR